MKHHPQELARGALLLTDGLALGFAGWIISGLSDFSGAALLGFVALLGNLAAAFFLMRRGATHRVGSIAMVFGLNAALLAASGLYIGETDDAPGAGLVGLLLLLANLAAAFVVVRRRAMN